MRARGRFFYMCICLNMPSLLDRVDIVLLTVIAGLLAVIAFNGVGTSAPLANNTAKLPDPAQMPVQQAPHVQEPAPQIAAAYDTQAMPASSEPWKPPQQQMQRAMPKRAGPQDDVAAFLSQ